jgi:hypothetical protein
MRGGGALIVVSRCVATPLVVRKFSASKGVSTEAEKVTALEAVTRQPVKTVERENLVLGVVNCSVCKLEIAFSYV